MLIWQDRRRPVGRYQASPLRAAANILIAAGILLMLSPAGWVAYTTLAVAPAQTAALAAWEQRAGSGGPAAAAPAPGGPHPAPAARAVQPGTTGLVLNIPRMGIRRFVPPGAHPDNLRRFGVGHLSWTSLPGSPGIVGIAGHRTTYGAPFFRLNALRPGDPILLEFGGRRYTYTVSRSVVVTPDRVDVLDALPGQRGIALVSCTPAYSAAYRLIVLGTLASVTPAPAP